MIATPPLIPRSISNALSLAIARRDTRQVHDLVEQNSLDVNTFLDSSTWMPLLMDALLSNSFETEEERLPLLRYLLAKAPTRVFAAAGDTTASTSPSGRINTSRPSTFSSITKPTSISSMGMAPMLFIGQSNAGC